MTALAQRIKETPLAPYTGLLDGLTSEQKMIVVTYITESMEKPKVDVVEQVRRKYGVAESESTKWFRELRGMTTRNGWAAAAKQAHADGEDRLMAADVFEDETMEDWKW
jgi:antitoxin MazE